MKGHKTSARERIVRLLVRVLTNPYIFTKKDLAKKFEVSIDTIEDDIDFLVRAGLHVDIQVKEQNQNHYAILPEKGFKELSHLRSLTENRHAEGDANLLDSKREPPSLVSQSLSDFAPNEIFALTLASTECLFSEADRRIIDKHLQKTPLFFSELRVYLASILPPSDRFSFSPLGTRSASDGCSGRSTTS